MSVVANACDRILACLQKLDAGAAKSLKPGLSIEVIEEKTKELLFPLTQEVCDLYQWRDGNPWSNGFIFSGNYWMLSLKDSLDAYSLRGAFADIRDLYYNCDDFDSKDDNYFWDRHWFPIFRSRDEHRFWIVKIGQESSPVLDVMPGVQCVELYPSLSEMLMAEAECFEKVIEIMNGRNCHPCDIDLHPDDLRLRDIRHKYGYKLDYF